MQQTLDTLNACDQSIIRSSFSCAILTDDDTSLSRHTCQTSCATIRCDTVAPLVSRSAVPPARADNDTCRIGRERRQSHRDSPALALRHRADSAALPDCRVAPSAVQSTHGVRRTDSTRLLFAAQNRVLCHQLRPASDSTRARTTAHAQRYRSVVVRRDNAP